MENNRHYFFFGPSHHVLSTPPVFTMTNLNLNSHIALVPLIGPAYARRLDKLNICTVRDLLYHLPFRYDDFSLVSKIANLQEGETVTVQGKILEIKNEYTRGGFVLQKAKIEDGTGVLDVLWFNQRFLTRVVSAGNLISLSGKIGKKRRMESPQYEIGSSIHTGRLVPVYPETAGISSKWLRSRLWFLLQNLEISDYENIHRLSIKEALNQVHFPKNAESATLARRRLAFDELLISNLQAKIRKEQLNQKVVGNKFNNLNVKITFPFELTNAQKRVTEEIFADLQKNTPMNRLLQGDVGSGKTVVAALAMLAASLNGYQSVLMAPTEILAFQHFETLKNLGLNVGLVTGSQKKSLETDILVGTHALLNNKLNISRLGLVVIDEQHRFGVSQRSALADKGFNNPHVLTMTATPIPRTVALTLYGDLDISLLDEMPENRLPVKTWVVPPEKRAAAYDWIKTQKTQTFIICPFIEPSESLTTVKSAKEEFKKIKNIFPEYKVGLLHGKLKPKEKNLVLDDFKNKQIDILVATPVVEVGIDIPLATIMVIEGADRFGLANLHQLRGRVGRSHQQSYCLVFGDTPRVKSLETIPDGLKLAELDLKMRGPGQRFGTSQHGRWDLKIADFDDLELIEEANTQVQHVLKNPQKFPLLLEMLKVSTIIA